MNDRCLGAVLQTCVHTPEPVNMAPYLPRGLADVAEAMDLTIGGPTLDYWGGPSGLTKALTKAENFLWLEQERRGRSRAWREEAKSERDSPCCLEDGEKGLDPVECRSPPVEAKSNRSHQAAGERRPQADNLEEVNSAKGVLLLVLMHSFSWMSFHRKARRPQRSGWAQGRDQEDVGIRGRSRVGSNGSMSTASAPKRPQASCADQASPPALGLCVGGLCL